MSVDTRSFADIIVDIGEQRARLSNREKSEDVIINLGSPITVEHEPLQEIGPVESNLNVSEVNTGVLCAEVSLQGTVMHDEEEPVKEGNNVTKDLQEDAENEEMQDPVQDNWSRRCVATL